MNTRITAVRADPDDNAYLEPAVEGDADIIVTGDRHLLDLDSFAGVPIVKAADFLNRLDQE